MFTWYWLALIPFAALVVLFVTVIWTTTPTDTDNRRATR